MPKLSNLKAEAGAWVEAAVNSLPGSIGVRVRRAWFGRTLARLGPGAVIGDGLLVRTGSRIEIGEEFSCWRMCSLMACLDGRIVLGARVSFNANVYLNACSGGTIVLGNDVLIGPNVVMRASDHRFDRPDVTIREQGHVAQSIVIEDDVWIAANVTVVGGVRIGRGSVVAANAVVTRDVPPNTVVAGVPARPVSSRT